MDRFVEITSCIHFHEMYWACIYFTLEFFQDSISTWLQRIPELKKVMKDSPYKWTHKPLISNKFLIFFMYNSLPIQVKFHEDPNILFYTTKWNCYNALGASLKIKKSRWKPAWSKECFSWDITNILIEVRQKISYESGIKIKTIF